MHLAYYKYSFYVRFTAKIVFEIEVIKNKHLYLIIYILFFSKSFCQNLTLEVFGKNKIETKVIDSLNYKKQFNNYLSIETEVNSIKKKLEKLGYLENKLLQIKKETDSTYFAKFYLNKRYKNIRIYYNSLIDKDLLNSIVDNIEDDYFEISIDKLENVLKLLNTEISQQGDPFSTLQLNGIKNKNTTLYANLAINKKFKRSIDSVIIKGYKKFPKSFVKRYLRIRPKQTFSLNDIKEKMLSLKNLRFAQQIKEPEVLFTKDSTLLYIYIEKVKSNSFDGFLGFGTNKDTNKLEFDGYLNLILTNNLNYGETLKIFYKSDENEQRTIDIKAELPFLFGSPIGADLGLNIFRKDSTFLNASQHAKIFYQINPNNKVGIGINSINSSYLLDESSANLDDFKSSFYALNFNHEERQLYDVLFPINFLFDFSAGIGTRTIDNINESQTRFTLNTFKIFNLNNKNSIYTRISGAILTSNSYLENELFRFGGINSIRGFEENSLIGNLFSVINTEYRYRVSNSLYIHSVFDAAYSENKIIDSKSKLFGFGFGFGLLTNAGLFKFNYTSAKTENQQFKLSDSKIHISLTADF